MAYDEGSDKEGGKGDGNGDEGGGQATATLVKKRVRTSRAMVTRVVGNKEGGGDGGNMVRNNDNGLVPVIVQQVVLYSASASLDNAGDDRTMTKMTTTLSCHPLMLRCPLILLSLASPLGA